MAPFYPSLLTAVTPRSRWMLLLLLVAARGMALAQTITSLAPASGPVGTSVTISGTNLTGATTVRFNGTVQSTILSNTATSLAVAVPAGATSGLVTVTTAAGTSGGRSFTVTAVPLAITAVSPTANVRNATVGSPVSATFNQALASTSASALKVYSAQRGGLRTRGATPGVVSGSILAYAPTQPWVAGETVMSTVTTAAAGSAGGTLAKAKVMRFTAAVAGTGRGIFSGTTNYSIPVSNGNTDYLAMGDVDGDGDLDMLTANDNPNGTVSVRFNNGTGTFSGSQNVAVDGFPRVVKLADVDGDGDLDFLAVNDRSSTANSAYGSSVSVRFNNGAGVFSGTQNVETGDFSYGLDIGDLDGDGDLDFATANYASTDVRVRLNNGTGTFSAGVTISLPGIYPQTVAMGDVDGDGDLDMLTSGGSGTVSVLLNSGNATFNAGTSASAYADYNLTLGDVDGDNDLDLVAAAQNSNNVQIRLNNGAGVFSGGQNIPVTTGPRGVALGDLDADGDLDLVTNNIGLTTNYGNTVSVRFNNGAGVFSAQATTPDLVVGTLPWHVALADIDGDNDLDVLTANNNSTVSLRFNGLVTAPTITSFTPASGPVGTLVTVTGTDLANTTAVKLNGVAITSYTVVNTATLTFTVPAGATSGLLTVTTPLGTATSATPFTVTVPNAVPTITSLSPSSVLVNSGAFILTVNGTGFVSGSVVNFLRGTVPTTFVSATQLTASISAADLTDLADFNVTVTSPTPGGGTSGGARFQVYLPAPTITSFTPASGPVGTMVTVQGTNFQLVTNVGLAAPGNVYIAPYTVVNATTITFTVPAGATSGLVGVATSSGTAYSATNFTVTVPNPVPTITALSPTTAVAGSGPFSLTVSGTGFLASSVVNFNGTALATTYVSPTQLTAAVPATAVASAGSFAVSVTSPAPGGGTSAALAFVVTTPAPTITSFTPAGGGTGTVVTITGTDFTGATEVRIGILAVPTFTVVSATSITLAVPSSFTASGLIKVTTPSGTATSATPFGVVLAATSGQAQPELSVYPNPFQTTLTVALPNSDAAQVTLRDVTGRLVLSSRPLPVSRQLLLPADLARGIYFLEVRQGDLTTTRRVVKQ